MINTNKLYIEDIYFNNGILNFECKQHINLVVLKQSTVKIKSEIKANKLDLIDIIEKNINFIPTTGLYEVQLLNENSDVVELLVDIPTVKGKEYVCKNYNFTYLTYSITIDIYINNKNQVKLKITRKNLEEIKYINKIENIQIGDEEIEFKISSSIKRVIEREGEEGESVEEILPVVDKDIRVTIFDKELDNIYTYKATKKNDNIYTYNVPVKEIIKDQVNELKIIITVDGCIKSYKYKEIISFKKLRVKESDSVKFVKLSITEDKKVKLDIQSEFKIKPVITSIKYENGLVFTGNINYNNNFINLDNVNLKALICTKDNKCELEKDIQVLGNKFTLTLTELDIMEIKKLSSSNWIIKMQLQVNDLITEYRLNYNKKSKLKILNKKLFIENQNINLKINLTKNDKELELSIRNNITVTKILHILYKDNLIEIKYRTKENIQNILDSKKLITTISNEKGEYKSSRIKKKGAKTFIAYYQGKSIEEFIQEAIKNGIKVSCIHNDKTSISFIKDVDTDTIFNKVWQKVQRSKKYKKICDVLYRKLFLKMPLNKKRVMFESFLGRNISGNPKYLYNQFVKENLDKEYELIWILNNIEEDIEGNCKKVKRKSLKYYYYIATSKYWIFNCRQADEIKKRKGNIYLQTWHGTPLKKLGMDMDNVSMAGQNDINDYKQKFYNNSRRWDYLLAQNDYSKEIFKSAFAFDKEILGGYPANDILYNENNEQGINKIKEKLGIPKNKKVILYAPTWRDDNFYKKGHYRMNIQLDLDRMKKELGNEYIILLRMHYLITNNINIDKYKGFVYDYSQGYDIQELYLVSDVLITDYSSVMFDYSNLNRQIIFFTYDIEQYRDSLRGFYFDFEKEAPGPLVVDTEGVIDSLKSLENVNREYKEKKIDFYNKFCHIDDGRSGENILEKILV